MEMSKNQILEDLLKINKRQNELIMQLLLNEKNTEGVKDSDEITKYVISDLLDEIGVPVKIIGYEYLRCGIQLCIEDPEMLKGLTKILYPKIASLCKTTSPRVERGIRHALEITWKNPDNFDRIKNLFGHSVDPSRGKPKNGEAIAVFVETLKKRI